MRFDEMMGGFAADACCDGVTPSWLQAVHPDRPRADWLCFDPPRTDARRDRDLAWVIWSPDA
jgi:hypothetical protein